MNKKIILLVHTTYEDGTECSETSVYKIQTPGNYPKEKTKQNRLSPPIRLNFICGRFGALYLFQLCRLCEQKEPFFLFTRPTKMEQCSETSVYKIQTPGNYPKERTKQNRLLPPIRQLPEPYLWTLVHLANWVSNTLLYQNIHSFLSRQ